MDKKSYLRAAVVALLSLAGLMACAPARLDTRNARNMATAQAPLPTGYPLSTQHKMQALQHWDSLAAKVAENCSRAMDHFFPEANVPVYVAPAGATPFALSMHESLLTHLVAYGIPTAMRPEGAAVLEMGVIFLAHDRALASTEDGTRPSPEPGFKQHKDSRGLYQAVSVVAEESGYFPERPTDAEIQVNTALVYQDAYLYRDSNFFYVDRQQWAHYQERAPRGVVQFKRYELVRQ